MIARAAEGYAEASNKKGGLEALKRDNEPLWKFGQNLKALFEKHTSFTAAEQQVHDRREAMFAALEEKRRESTRAVDAPSE